MSAGARWRPFLRVMRTKPYLLGLEALGNASPAGHGYIHEDNNSIHYGRYWNVAFKFQLT